MADETTKQTLRRSADHRYITRWFVGDGVDIGCGADPLSNMRDRFPLIRSVRPWDLADGDAMAMAGVADESFDFVHSSHCLEHLGDPRVALGNWIRICRRGGHLVVTVPDEDLYEQGVWPSTFNADHKWSFTIQKGRSWSPRSVSLVDLLGAFRDEVEVLRIERLDSGFRHGAPRVDQTLGAMSESAIEFVLRRRPVVEEKPVDESELFARAVRSHADGRLDEAREMYRSILAVDGHNPTVLNNAALLEPPGTAEAYLRRAISVGADYIDPHINLGDLLIRALRFDEAERVFQGVARSRPDDPRLAAGLAALRAARANGAATGAPAPAPSPEPPADAARSEEIPEDARRFAAVVGREEVARVFAEAVGAHQAGRVVEAWNAYQRVIGADPENAAALNNAALLAADETAEAYLRRALAVRGDYLDALINLGGLLSRTGRFPEAAEVFERALRVAPTDARALTGAATAYEGEGDHRAAIAVVEADLDLFGPRPDALHRLGVLLESAGDPRGALRRFEEVLALVPDHRDAHIYAGRQHLKLGDLIRGAEEIAWMWRGVIPESQIGLFRDPEGHPIRWDGRTVLISADSGLGDTIQFVRAAIQLRELGARVVVECPPTLTRLIATMDAVDEVVPTGRIDLPFDVRVPMHNLIGAFRTTLDTIPAPVPYLKADPRAVDAFRARLAAHPGPRIGLCRSGNPSHPRDGERSIAEAALAPALARGDLTLVNLRPGDVWADPRVVDWTAEVGDLADTAALIEALDLVVTVDTVVAHLAGALGRPVWLLDRVGGCWRWLETREDSPWYPTMRIFRQTRPGDWSDTVRDLARALEERFGAPTAGVAAVPAPAPTVAPVNAGSTRPLFSVIVPTHRRSTLLRRALRSIREGAGDVPVEILVVSDVIDARTSAVCDELLSGADTHIRRGGAPGPAISRNMAMDIARGDHILFLDDDDAWHPDLLPRLLAAGALDGGGPVYLNCSVVNERRPGGEPQFISEAEVDLAGRLSLDVYVKNQVHMSCFVFPRPLLDGLRFDAAMRAYEDWDFQLSVFDRAWPVHKPILASRVFEVPDDTTDRRGAGRPATDFNAVLDYLYVFRRHRAPTPEIGAKRAELISRFGVPLTPEFA